MSTGGQGEAAPGWLLGRRFAGPGQVDLVGVRVGYATAQWSRCRVCPGSGMLAQISRVIRCRISGRMNAISPSSPAVSVDRGPLF